MGEPRPQKRGWGRWLFRSGVGDGAMMPMEPQPAPDAVHPTETTTRLSPVPASRSSGLQPSFHHLLHQNSLVLENDPPRMRAVLSSASEFPWRRPGQVLDTVFISRRPVHPSKEQHNGCVAQLLDVDALHGLPCKLISTIT